MNIITYYSILQSLLSPEKIVKECKRIGYESLIVIDTNLSSVVQFYKECKKNEIKPVIGLTVKVCELPISDDPFNRMYDLQLVAKNKQGYKNLLKIISTANKPDHILKTDYQKVPRVHLSELAGLTDGIICLQGDVGTEFYYFPTEYTINKYKEVFNDVVLNNEDGICWSNVRYLHSSEQEDFHILLCILLKCKLTELDEKLNHFPVIKSFYKEDLSLKQKYAGFSEERINRTLTFFNSIDEYDILSNPKVPKFECPNGIAQQEYLRDLCRLGWKKRFKVWESKEKETIYAERVKYELRVINQSSFDGYFLLVQDYINWAKSKGWLVGYARGSSAGCLISYLIGITEIDPIKHDIPFERFLQEGRNSLPDIDTDFPKDKRGEVIRYIENKYGKERVCHIATFGTLKGAGALTEVLRVHDVFESKKIKSITKSIPTQDKISDKMEEQGETSVLMFTLKNYPNVLCELGNMNDDGEIAGEYSYYLEQAIRIEGCIRGSGIHASGILISDEPLVESCGMMIENSGENIISSLDMDNSADVGLVKVDILGLEDLDKLMDLQTLLLGTCEDQ